jgi:hypothetical protein
LGLAFVLALVASLMAAIPAASASVTIGVGTDAGTTADVSNGTAGTPNIECIWLLPDYDGPEGGDNFTDPAPGEGMDYGPDDSSKSPLGTGDDCTADPALAAGTFGPAIQNDAGTESLIQVMPNAHDRCAYQRGTPAYDDPDHAFDCLQHIEVWAAVDEASPGNTLVLADVYHPDLTLKVNIVMTRLDAYNGDVVGQYGQGCTFPAGMEEAATALTGQVTTAAFDNMKWECREQSKAFFYGAFDLSKHQPWGKYDIVVTAETIGGGIDTQSAKFYVLPFTQLEKDFASVSFGSISAGSAIEPAHGFSQPAGDFVWDGVDNASGTNKTTIRNVGNAGAQVGVWFDPLCYNGILLNCKDDVKRIDKFDAKFGAYQGTSAQSTLIAYGYDFYGVGNDAPYMAWMNDAHYQDLRWFDDGDKFEATLCPNQVGKIEFSLWTTGIRQGSYSGVAADGSPGGIHLETQSAYNTSTGSSCPTDHGKAEAPHLTGLAYTGYWGNS